MTRIEDFKLFEDRKALQHELNRLSTKYIKMGCKVEIALRYYDSVYLTLIEVPEGLRGKGIASQFMKDLTEWADSKKMVITLSATDSMGSSISRLEEFYSRFGFIKNRLNRKDSQYVGGMIRFPQ